MGRQKSFNIKFEKPVTLLGGAGFTSKDLKKSLKYAPEIVSADGGVNYLKDEDKIPSFIIGDCDSVKEKKIWESKGSKVIQIIDQNSTDFEKCIKNINAPKFICLGFASERLDHFLAVCSALTKYTKPILVLGNRDVIFHLPRKFNVRLPINSRISLFPLRQIGSIRSRGLKYALDGLLFSPTNRVGTSNSSVGSDIEISYEGGGMLAILSKEHLEKVWQNL